MQRITFIAGLEEEEALLEVKRVTESISQRLREWFREKLEQQIVFGHILTPDQWVRPVVEAVRISEQELIVVDRSRLGRPKRDLAGRRVAESTGQSLLEHWLVKGLTKEFGKEVAGKVLSFWRWTDRYRLYEFAIKEHLVPYALMVHKMGGWMEDIWYEYRRRRQFHIQTIDGMLYVLDPNLTIQERFADVYEFRSTRGPLTSEHIATIYQVLQDMYIGGRSRRFAHYFNLDSNLRSNTEEWYTGGELDDCPDLPHCRSLYDAWLNDKTVSHGHY
jgi:hypothetical protein